MTTHYAELEDVNSNEAGQVAIVCGGQTLSVGETLKEAIKEFNHVADDDDQITVDEILDDRQGLTEEDLYWTEISA